MSLYTYLYNKASATGPERYIDTRVLNNFQYQCGKRCLFAQEIHKKTKPITAAIFTHGQTADPAQRAAKLSLPEDGYTS